MPKGLRINMPNHLLRQRSGFNLQRKTQNKILKKSISDIHIRINAATKEISIIKLTLREFELGNKWLIDIENHLMKIVRRMVSITRRSHNRKLAILLKEKNTNSNNKKNEVDSAKQRCKKKIIYNNSSRNFTQEEMNVLSLGLNCGIRPKKFPIVEYIQATESLCQQLDNEKSQNSKDRSQKSETSH